MKEVALDPFWEAAVRVPAGTDRIPFLQERLRKNRNFCELFIAVQKVFIVARRGAQVRAGKHPVIKTVGACDVYKKRAVLPAELLKKSKQGISAGKRFLEAGKKFVREGSGNRKFRQTGTAGDEKLTGHNFRFGYLFLQLANGYGRGRKADAAFFPAFPDKTAGRILGKGFSRKYRYLRFPDGR